MPNETLLERRRQPRGNDEVGRVIARLRAEIALLRAGNDVLRRTAARYWLLLEQRNDDEPSG